MTYTGSQRITSPQAGSAPQGSAPQGSSAPRPAQVIGMIGSAAVGKTTYFAVLDRALKRCGWSVEVGTSGEDTPGQRAFGEKLVRDVRVTGRWPEKTSATKPDPDQLSMRITNDAGHQLVLAFYDPAGELFDPRREPRAYERQRDQVFGSMRQCTGILVLLDPHMPQQHLINTWELSVGSFRSYIRENGLNHLLVGDKLAPRVAVVLTKADRLPFLRRHRTRRADLWLEHEAQLGRLVADVRRTCSDVQFHFCSAVGWADGAENCRTYVVPKPLQRGDAEQFAGEGDLIPDPARPAAVAGHLDAPLRMGQTSLPLFRDPLQIADHGRAIRLPTQSSRGGGQPADPALAAHQDAMGVLVFPGRQAPSAAEAVSISPWNVAEPLLWAAGASPAPTGASHATSWRPPWQVK